jgi:hypothetical protein
MLQRNCDKTGMLRCLEIEFLYLSANYVAVSSIWAAPFSNMCSTRADKNSGKLQLPVSLCTHLKSCAEAKICWLLVIALWAHIWILDESQWHFCLSEMVWSEDCFTLHSSKDQNANHVLDTISSPVRHHDWSQLLHSPWEGHAFTCQFAGARLVTFYTVSQLAMDYWSQLWTMKLNI